MTSRMGYDYDKLYRETPDALGKPTRVFVDFFNRFGVKNARVLDVGCGQGRDALFIARMGHRVVGVDLFPNGIRDLLNAAARENLNLKGVVSDIKTFVPNEGYDVVLIDRTLHMLPEKTRLEVLDRLVGSVQSGGWLLIADERSNMAGFKDVIAANSDVWETELDTRGCLFLRRPR